MSIDLWATEPPRSHWRQHPPSTTIQCRPPHGAKSDCAPEEDSAGGVRRRPLLANRKGIPMPFIQRLGLQGLLSFPPDMEPFDLQPLNVLIGPNGSGKTNVIEALELLHAAPTSLKKAIQAGGGISEWVWKGDRREIARISVKLQGFSEANGHIIYLLEVFDFAGLPLMNDESMELIVAETSHREYPFNLPV